MKPYMSAAATADLCPYTSLMQGGHEDMVIRACKAWCDGDISVYREMYAPDVVAEGGGMWPEGEGAITGVEALIARLASVMRAFERSELEPVRFLGKGDALAAEILWRGVMAGSDTPVEQRLACAYRFREGLIVYTAWFAELEGALSAVGLDGAASTSEPAH